jgi:predicted Ser/Thr protein kinase
LQASHSKLLKKDLFGRTELISGNTNGPLIRRDARAAAAAVRWLARKLLAREARALAILDGTPGIPALVRVDRDTLERGYIEGSPMQVSKPANPRYFRNAASLLRQLHRKNIVHNDLAKEPNLLVDSSGRPAIIDFQLAWFAPGRGRLFRILAREDIRHLLKHKRTYCPNQLTRRELDILNSPSYLARIWMRTGKPLYVFVTRRILGWRDREGAGDRQ